MKISTLLPLLLITFVNVYTQPTFKKLAEDLNFPEGPAWNGKQLFISSCYGGYIAEISENKSTIFVDSSYKNFKQTNGLTFDKDGNLFACEYGIGLILKISPQKTIEVFAEGFEGENFNRPNDLAFDPNGNLYFTDPKSYGKDKPDGRIFRIEKHSKKVELLADSLCFPNGIAFSADGKYLYICESAKNRVLKFSVAEDGSIGNKNIFIELPGGDPDGIAFDIEGNLYIAHFGSGNIFVVSPQGEIIQTIKTPGKKPSNVEFAGENMRTLFITEDETNSVYKTEVDIPGVLLFGLK